MAAPVLVSIENAPYQDGLHLLVKLASAPTGPVSFYASPLPGVPEQVVGNLKPVTTTISPVEYKVKIRSGSVDEPPRLHRMPYYVVAEDNDGVSAPLVEWICCGLNTDWMNQVNETLQDILIANSPLLDRSMILQVRSGAWPSGRDVAVRKIHRGEPQSEEGSKFPRVCHHAIAINEDYLGGSGEDAGVPYSDYVPISSRIQCYALWQSDVEWGFVLNALGMAVFNTLNQPHYVRLKLDCGLTLFQCRVNNGSLQEYYDASLNAWIVAFTMDWTGNLHAAKYTPDLY